LVEAGLLVVGLVRLLLPVLLLLAGVLLAEVDVLGVVGLPLESAPGWFCGVQSGAGVFCVAAEAALLLGVRELRVEGGAVAEVLVGREAEVGLG
jgi:hypothetical protein